MTAPATPPQSLDDDLQPIRALNDLLYCERRCALHRIEGVWRDNAHTLQGTLSHQRADKLVTWESAAGMREVHGMWLKSDRLRLVGRADVIEFRIVGQAHRLTTILRRNRFRLLMSRRRIETALARNWNRPSGSFPPAHEQAAD